MGFNQQQQQQQQNFATSRSSALTNSLSSSQSTHNQQHQYHQQSNNSNMSDYASVGSYYSRGSHGSASQQSSIQVDEAARRLGHRLSMRAHGDLSASRHHPQRASRLGMTPKSGFLSYGGEEYQQQKLQQKQVGTNDKNEGNNVDSTGEIRDGGDVDMNSQATPAGVGLGGESSSIASANLNRTAKVAKTRYSDHGDHHRHNDNDKPSSSSQGNIVRKMTINVADFFRVWQQEAINTAGKGRKKRQSPTHERVVNNHTGKPSTRQDLSPQRFAFSQLALDTAGGGASGHQQSLPPGPTKQQQKQQQQSLTQQLREISAQQLQQQQKQRHHHHHPSQYADNNASSDHHSLFSAAKDNETGGHLTAVIERASPGGSSKTRSLENDSRSLKSLASANSSIATKEELEQEGGGGNGEANNTMNNMNYSTNKYHNKMTHPPTPLPQGKCLTQPSVPTSNNDLDNAEGNLIVHENDTISLTRKQIHVLTKEKMKNARRADFRVIGLLGQGTFAQVFQCYHIQTDQMVAVKVVKNKPAYTRQAAVEIDVFRALVKKSEKNTNVSSSQSHKVASSPSIQDDTATTAGASILTNKDTKWEHMVDLICYFMYKSHLCLVFEILGLNLYEVLKRRQFRGLPLSIVRSLLRQAVGGVKELAKKSIVHCDIKPENILLAREDDTDSVVTAGESLANRRRQQQIEEQSPTEPAIQGNLNQTLKKLKAPDKLSASPGNSLGTAGTVALTKSPGIKLIDFGSACFEGQTAHTYIQSRFYRSPEVLVGLPYDSAIDMWSLGCVAAELFLGLPILPGVHEHDQLSRVSEMIAKMPDWMIEQGSKSPKYYVKYMPRSSSTEPQDVHSRMQSRKPQWRLQTQQEYIASLSPSEIRKKGGLAKLEKQPTNRYFKKRKLADIIMHKGLHGKPEDMESLDLFIHFLYGILDPDPWRRWTAHQASSHPFISGGTIQRRSQGAPFGEAAKDQNQANSVGDIYWDPPWDPGICRRKLLNVQKMREKQNVPRRGSSSYRNHHGNISQNRPSSASSEGSAGERNFPTKAAPINHSAEVGNRPTQQGLGGVMAAQGGLGAQLQRSQYQMSTSFSDLPNHSQFVNNGDDVSVGGMSNPYLYQNVQSYTGAVETEFAYALQRPGVIPMGGSVASFDLSVGQSSQQAPPGGSYGGNRAIHSSGQQRLNSANHLSSQSFGGNVADQSSVGATPGSLGQYPPSSLGQHASQQQQVLPPAASGVASSLGQQLAGSIPTPGSLGQQLQQPGSFNLQSLPGAGQQPSSIPQSIDAANVGVGQLGNLGADPAFAQAYLQQQHAALQQQQALLQQQQAALALQQEQLRSYGVNPALFNMNNLAAAGGGVGMNQFAQQTQLIGQQQQQQQMLAQQHQMQQQQMMMAQQPQQLATNNGYYYVTAADGTPMLVSNQGAPQQQQQQQGQFGMPSAYGMPQNYQNFEGGGY